MKLLFFDGLVVRVVGGSLLLLENNFIINYLEYWFLNLEFEIFYSSNIDLIINGKIKFKVLDMFLERILVYYKLAIIDLVLEFGCCLVCDL